MDQGLAWCPEFRATRSMADYPSRKAQLIRAMHYGQIPPSEHAAEILFHTILSFQGERWQVFNEPPSAWTKLLILGRQAVMKAGFGTGHVEEMRRAVGAAERSAGSLEIPTVRGGTDWLHVDATGAATAAASADRIGALLKRAGVRIRREVRPSAGLWELFAYGAVEEGVLRARALVTELQALGVRRVVTLEGQGAWLWRTFLPEAGVSHPFEVLDILEVVKRLEVDKRTFLSAGSFRARALHQAERLNGLVEPGLRAAPVTIWQRPVGAEHILVGFPPKTAQMIFEDALEEIRASGCTRIVVFDPHAYHGLRAAPLPEEVTYFTEVIA
jgi:hypothetical protein